jgi:hypothetical protein
MKKSPIELINLVFSGLMVLISFTGVLVFFFTDLVSDRAYGNKRIILGLVFLAYAIYRSYRMYSSIKQQKKVIS